MDFCKIKELKSIFTQKKFYYFLTKLRQDFRLCLEPSFMFHFFKKLPRYTFQELFSRFFCLFQNLSLLLAMGMSWSQIIQATGLTEDQLKQLQS